MGSDRRLRSRVPAVLSRALLPFVLSGFIPQRVAAQLEPPSTGGTVVLQQELRRLGHYKRVLVIGAHPDDEDTELLTILVRGMGAEAAYLSLNRGEGGQNLIGPELGEELGIIRTEELLGARNLDGARQYFTRAYDFGFSKSLAETWKHWPQDSILKDVVRIIRRFRPQVVVAIFSGTPRDGHGQHQAAGWAAREAFRIAGDSTRFPELEREERLEAWTPLKFYRSTRFDTTATTLTLDGGVIDEAVGQSFHQIAMRGRSLHRSQDMGQLQRIGPSPVRLALLEDRTGRRGAALFDGIDTTLAGVPAIKSLTSGDPSGLRAGLARYLSSLDSARAVPASGGPQAVFALLSRALRELDDAAIAIYGRTYLERCPGGTGACPGPVDAGPELRDEADRLSRLVGRSSGVVMDAVADAATVTPGGTVAVTASVWNASGAPVGSDLCTLSASSQWALADGQGANGQGTEFPGGCLSFDSRRARWDVTGSNEGAIPAGAVVTARLTARVPDSLSLSMPYFLHHPRVGDLYRWDPADRWSWGEPFEDPLLALGAEIDLGHPYGLIEREVTYRTNDQALGEVREPLFVVPRIGVSLDPSVQVWPIGVASPRTFTVTLRHYASDTTSGTLRLELPSGWPVLAARPFRLSRENETQTFEFQVRAPAGLRSGVAEIRAVAEDAGGRRFTEGVEWIDYPHIRPHQLVRHATTRVEMTSLGLPPLARVGYVRGASDRVPEALMEVGVPIVLLDRDALTRGDLSRFDAIVVGSRAYETDTALVEHNDRLLAYARGGGLVIVQYQQYQFVNGNFAPYPLTLSQPHDRVTEEDAPVRLVAPEDPVFHRPNVIGATDWAGWVQERGLYFAHSWDPRYRALLESHDSDGPPLEGGLLVAPVGSGTYVYTGLSFFRELPAGVPGAFRLFANLLALSHHREP